MLEPQPRKTYEALSISGVCLQKEITIFPNPASNHVTVQVPEAAEMQIFDHTSRLISSHILQQGETSVPTAHLASSVYILRFTIKNGEIINKSLIVK